MSKQLAFFIDAKLCVGCATCGMACKNQYHQDEGVVWRQIYPLSEDVYPFRERAFYSLACNHCAKPVCRDSCPVGAYTKREDDGIVIQDNDKCIGCKNCVRSCPYGAPRYNTARRKTEKCSLCSQRVDAGKEPACVHSCPTGALSLVDLATFSEPGTVQYPPGYPRSETLDPSSRFRTPSQPVVVRRSI